MKTYKLHQLIEMALAGKKFKAFRDGGEFSFDLTSMRSWNWHEVTADWTVEFKPEVVEFELSVSAIGIVNWSVASDSKKLKGKKWRFVATEVVEDK